MLTAEERIAAIEKELTENRRLLKLTVLALICNFLFTCCFIFF